MNEQYRELRRKFRDDALNLSSACDSLVGWEASQRLLGSIWDGDDDEPKTKAADGAPPDRAILYACQTCGFVLHPGFLGTTLRLASCRRNKKRGDAVVSRTRRRREQRRKRRASVAKQKQKKDSNSQKNIDSLPQMGAKVLILEDDPRVAFDRHHLTITCGRCRCSVRCKGLKKDERGGVAPSAYRQYRNSSSGNNGRPSAIAVEKTWRNSARREGKAEARTAPVTGPTSDFVKLPSASSLFAENKLGNDAPPIIQAADQRKKKKKKKALPPKSNLMNFLNSLND